MSAFPLRLEGRTDNGGRIWCNRGEQYDSNDRINDVGNMKALSLVTISSVSFACKCTSHREGLSWICRGRPIFSLFRFEFNKGQLDWDKYYSRLSGYAEFVCWCRRWISFCARFQGWRYWRQTAQEKRFTNIAGNNEHGNWLLVGSEAEFKSDGTCKGYAFRH